MNFSLLLRHRGLLVVFLVSLISPMILSFSFGTPKAYAEYKWTDIIGEGSVALLAMFWLITALASRPPGKVTRLLVVGLACFMFSGLLDVLDEFVRYPANANGLSVVESIPAAIGMIIMTLALYYWHLEQLALNRQLQRRELQYRAVEQIDVITQLYRADYWRERVLTLQQENQRSAIIALDINNFTDFNLRFGNQEGDRFLRELSHLILMNLRPIDLACRYAGDRFVIVLPGADDTFALDVAKQIERSIKHVAFRANAQTTAVFQSVRTAICLLTPDCDLQHKLMRVNQALDNHVQLTPPSDAA